MSSNMWLSYFLLRIKNIVPYFLDNPTFFFSFWDDSEQTLTQRGGDFNLYLLYSDTWIFNYKSRYQDPTPTQEIRYPYKSLLTQWFAMSNSPFSSLTTPWRYRAGIEPWRTWVALAVRACRWQVCQCNMKKILRKFRNSKYCIGEVFFLFQ